MLPIIEAVSDNNIREAAGMPHHPGGSSSSDRSWVALGCYLLLLTVLLTVLALTAWQAATLARDLAELKQMQLSGLSRMSRMERALDRIETLPPTEAVGR